MFRVTDQLAKAVRQWPNAPAVTCAAGSFSYAELDKRVRALATVLFEQGLKKGDRVGYLGFNSHLTYECFLAAPLIGAAAVPLNFRLSKYELIDMLNDCRPKVVVVDEAHHDLLQECLPSCPSIERVLRQGAAYEEAIANAPDAPDFEMLSSGGDDLLIIIYTGGTTGRSKGVMLSHTNIYSNQMAILSNWEMHQGEGYCLTGPLFHVAGSARLLTAPMLGNHMVLMPKFDITELMRLIQTHTIKIAQFVPTMIAMMLDHPDFGKYDVTSLRLITYGSAPMQPELIARVMKALPHVGFAQAFGMTEAAPIATLLNPEDHMGRDEAGLRRLYSVGRAAPFLDMKIVDENRRERPIGEVGEIALRGPNIMKGYWEKPDLTAEVLEKGWYYTGDAGSIDAEGYLHLAGRYKDMVITGGENVYPIEVERILDAHPDVADVAIIGTPDDKWGERVHAIIRPTAGSTPDEQALKDYCRERLAHYKCPTLISFINDPLPLTKVNKTDKVALRKIYNKDKAGA